MTPTEKKTKLIIYAYIRILIDGCHHKITNEVPTQELNEHR
jgi:hypothetical protein